MIDLVEPGFIEFDKDGTGQIHPFHRFCPRDGQPGAEFTWSGDDEGNPVSGRGWTAVVDHGSLGGHIFFHLGDDSGSRAVRQGLAP